MHNFSFIKLFKNFLQPIGLRSIYAVSGLFLFIVISSFNVAPDDEVDQLYKSSHNRLSKQGVVFLKKHFVRHTEPCESISKVGGWVWKCTHRDGFATYNCFKKCRGTIEAARLFLGLNEDEDCDSFTLVNGEQKEVCYPKQATKIVNDHGTVIAIEIIRAWP